jgi:hypothetical protein
MGWNRAVDGAKVVRSCHYRTALFLTDLSYFMEQEVSAFMVR